MQEPQEMQVQTLGREDPLEEQMATHSSILAWRIPWTEEPSGLQSMGLQRVRHDWATMHASLGQIKPSFENKANTKETKMGRERGPVDVECLDPDMAGISSSLEFSDMWANIFPFGLKKMEKKLKWDRAYDIVSLYEMIYIFHGGHKSITTGPYREAIGECLVITRLRS